MKYGLMTTTHKKHQSSKLKTQSSQRLKIVNNIWGMMKSSFSINICFTWPDSEHTNLLLCFKTALRTSLIETS